MQINRLANVFRPQAAFTLIEIISVLILISILAAVAVPRFLDTGAEERVAVDTFKVHLRYAQLKSMYSDMSWGVASQNPNEYFMYNNGTLANKVRFMGEEEDTVSLPSGVNISDFTLSYDDWGRPFIGNEANTENGTLVPESGLSITIGDTSMTILHDTGFIQ